MLSNKLELSIDLMVLGILSTLMPLIIDSCACDMSPLAVEFVYQELFFDPAM